MKLAVLSYENSRNFGDEIQSIAAARLLPRIDLKIPRERLRSFPLQEPCVLVMNGFFDKLPGEFPPSDYVIPIYISFHIRDGAESFYTSPQCIEHFQKHAPIGCRDRGTMEILQAAGVEAYYSKCLTLTFPKREVTTADKIIAVDFFTHYKRISRRRLRRIWGHEDIVVLSHKHYIDGLGDNIKTEMATRLLQIYETSSRLVITTLVHCTLPCLAMGIPVMYFGSTFDRRTSILNDLGVQAHNRIIKSNRWLAKANHWITRKNGRTPATQLIWDAAPIDVEKEKKELISLFHSRLSDITK